jgi:hypothetical protein
MIRHKMHKGAGWGVCLLLCIPCLAQKEQSLRFDAALIKPYVRDPAMTGLMAPYTR